MYMDGMTMIKIQEQQKLINTDKLMPTVMFTEKRFREIFRANRPSSVVF